MSMPRLRPKRTSEVMQPRWKKRKRSGRRRTKVKMEKIIRYSIVARLRYELLLLLPHPISGTFFPGCAPGLLPFCSAHVMLQTDLVARNLQLDLYLALTVTSSLPLYLSSSSSPSSALGARSRLCSLDTESKIRLSSSCLCHPPAEHLPPSSLPSPSMVAVSSMNQTPLLLLRW